MERSTIFNGKTHYFDWAIFNSYVTNYQRVDRLWVSGSSSPSFPSDRQPQTPEKHNQLSQKISKATVRLGVGVGTVAAGSNT